MKNILIAVFILVLMFLGCSGKKDISTNIQAYNLDCYAYPADDGWEVNGSFQVKDFAAKEESGLFKSSFTYTVDLISADQKKTEKVALGNMVKEQKEKPADAQIDLQFIIKSTNKTGTYTLNITVTDETTKKTAVISKPIVLE